MTRQGLLQKKIQYYLNSLSPSARDLLVRGVEDGIKKGKTDEQLEMILSAARKLAREDDTDQPREEDLKRAFYLPIEPFIAKQPLFSRQQGRISRIALDAVWVWLKRDVSPGVVEKILEEGVTDPSLSEEEKALICAKKLRDIVLPQIATHLDQIHTVPVAEQRLAAQLGNNIILEELRDMMTGFIFGPVLSRKLKTVPAVMETFEDMKSAGFPATVLELLKAHSRQTAFIFSAILNRTRNAGELVILVASLAGTDDCTKIANSPFATGIDIAFSEFEWFACHLQKLGLDKSNIEEFENIANSYHLIDRKFERHLIIPPTSVWGKKRTEQRNRISQAIAQDLDGFPMSLRKALKLPGGRELERLDEIALEETSRGARILVLAEKIRDCLSLNEPIARARREVDQSFEVMINALNDRLRRATGEEHMLCQELAKHVLGFAETLISYEYSASLRRQFEVAGNSQGGFAAGF
ncbi:MAG: hypothetical protein JKY49_03790 [Cohaesibacteraceae bacterium]|nr:hypothetical protein [Cohaesibacteraceae bacterium]MBL4875838.1 hypothetical protein [Cohaesibacteraceae bacterium]